MRLETRKLLKNYPRLAFIGGFAVVGITLLLVTHASTPTASIEPEQTGVSGNATTVADTSASNGQYVKFGSGSSNSGGSVPTSPPVQNCGSNIMNNPNSEPSGAVTVPAGDNGSGITWNTPNTTYWFAPGVHTLGTSQYGQIDPGQGDTYIGAPGAILDGQKINNYAFVASYQAPWVTNVTIEYLTIQNFAPPNDQGAVNQNAGQNWTFMYDTIQNNVPGVALFLGSNDIVKYNCLTNNGQYGFSAYSATQLDPVTAGPANITLDNNEISYNNTCNWEGVSPNPVPVSLTMPSRQGLREVCGS